MNKTRRKSFQNTLADLLSLVDDKHRAAARQLVERAYQDFIVTREVVTQQAPSTPNKDETEIQRLEADLHTEQERRHRLERQLDAIEAKHKHDRARLLLAEIVKSSQRAIKDRWGEPDLFILEAGLLRINGTFVWMENNDVRMGRTPWKHDPDEYDEALASAYSFLIYAAFNLWLFVNRCQTRFTQALEDAGRTLSSAVQNGVGPGSIVGTAHGLELQREKTPAL